MDIVPSRYNFPLAADGSNYVFSAATGKLAVVKDAATWRFLQGRGLNGLSPSLAEKLLQDGFAVLSGTDEVGQLMSRRFEQYGRSPLEISVMPTDACGLGCDKCSHPSAACGGNSMALDVEDALASFAKEANRDIHVNWIGGEPLIASDVIEGLTRKLRSVARDNGNKYSSSMASVLPSRHFSCIQFSVPSRIECRQVTPCCASSASGTKAGTTSKTFFKLRTLSFYFCPKGRDWQPLETR